MDAFVQRVRQDVGEILTLPASGAITARVAARMPSAEEAEAVRLARSGAATGEVLLAADHRA